MDSQFDLGDRAARSLIAADAKFFSNLVLNPRLAHVRPTVLLAAMPFLGAFLYESIAYVKEETPGTLQNLQSHQGLLRAMRMGMKLLDGDPRSLEDILRESDELVALVKRWYEGPHRGLLGPLKRWLQPDLGIFFWNNDVINTTHVSLLNLGLTTEILSTLSRETVGPYMRREAVGYGNDVVQVLDELGMLQELDTAAHTPEDGQGRALPPTGYRDLKSSRFFESVARRAAPEPSAVGVGVLLSLILSRINTARVIVPRLALDNETAAFKIRFVSLFHAVTSLQVLLTWHHQNSFLHPEAVRQFKAMLGNDSIRSVRGRTKLRNNLVHYRVVSESVTALLRSDRPLYGLVEALYPGTSLADIRNDVTLGLDHISTGLIALLPETPTPEGTL
jgi:hypothetical protein